MIRLISCLVVLVSLAATPMVRAQLVIDTFNRPDSTDMGSNWVEQAGDITLVDGTARSAIFGAFSLMTMVDVTSDVISVDVSLTGMGTQYAALVLGYASLNHNLFVKVQNNNGGASFDTVFFYYGNNGSSFGETSASVPITPFQSGRMSLSLAGSVATLTLDTNFDGIADQTLTRVDVPTGQLGSHVGLGLYGSISADNFALAAIPEPSTYALLGLGGVALLIASRRRRLFGKR